MLIRLRVESLDHRSVTAHGLVVEHGLDWPFAVVAQSLRGAREMVLRRLGDVRGSARVGYRLSAVASEPSTESSPALTGEVEFPPYEHEKTIPLPEFDVLATALVPMLRLDLFPREGLDDVSSSTVWVVHDLGVSPDRLNLVANAAGDLEIQTVAFPGVWNLIERSEDLIHWSEWARQFGALDTNDPTSVWTPIGSRWTSPLGSTAGSSGSFFRTRRVP